MRLVDRIAAAASLLSQGFAVLATLLCLVLVSVSVVARYLFGIPLPWIDKAAGWLVVALVLLAAPETQRRFEHIGVDIVTERIGPRWARRAHILGVLSVAVVAGILLEAGIETVSFSQMIGIESELEGVPAWWLQLLLPIGAGVLLLVSLAQLVVLILGRDPPFLPRPEENPLDHVKIHGE